MKTVYIVGRLFSEGFCISTRSGIFKNYLKAEKEAKELNDSDKEQYAKYEVMAIGIK